MAVMANFLSLAERYVEPVDRLRSCILLADWLRSCISPADWMSHKMFMFMTHLSVILLLVACLTQNYT